MTFLAFQYHLDEEERVCCFTLIVFLLLMFCGSSSRCRLQYVIVVFPYHNHLKYFSICNKYRCNSLSVSSSGSAVFWKRSGPPEMADHSTQARKVSHCIQYDYCIKHASAERAKLLHVELIYLHKTASSVAKNIHSSLHRFIELSFSVPIIFEAMTQIFSCHSFETACRYPYHIYELRCAI